MRILLVGPPGSGKGTQAKLLSHRQQLQHVGMGDLLREAIRQKTRAGEQARPYVARGQLVPDAVVNRMMEEKFNREDRPTCFVMDGYPRILSQARFFDELLHRNGLDLDAVVLFSIDDEEIVRRLSSRRSCNNPKCGATYHLDFHPPKVGGVCDVCGSPLEQRNDDSEETVRHRLQIYHQNHDDLIAYYEARGLLRRISSDDEIENVYGSLRKVLQAG